MAIPQFSTSNLVKWCGQALVTSLLLVNTAWSFSDEALFQHARASYAARNEIALAEDVSQLKAQQYILAPYAEYWLMLLRLAEAEPQEVRTFLTQYADLPFADRLRGEWLKQLAKQSDWDTFFAEYPNFQRDDVAVRCDALSGQLAQKAGSPTAPEQIKTLWEQAAPIWLTGAELPNGCNQLFDTLQSAGVLSQRDIWARVRLALQDNKLTLAKNIAKRLPAVETADLKLFDRALQNPQQFLDKKVATYKSALGIEANLYALDRLARTKLDTAISSYDKLQALLSAEDRAFGWGRIALHAARAHHPLALEYFALADPAKLDKDQRAWQVRAALRIMDWQAVQQGIQAMPAKQQEEGTWRYWLARAFKEQALPVEANALFNQLANERHYYGWLALDELGSVMRNPDEEYTTTDLEVTAIASQPAIKRSIALHALDMRWEARAEWVWATRNFDDKQLLAAAEYAARQKWYDVAIITADNTKQVHDFNLRYPTPYRDLIHRSAKEVDLDEAWVYGLTRQESRFMHYAKSGVGASGLMQLMPATAKWAAKRMGIDDYSHDKIHQLDTNIDIGTYYMRYTLDLMYDQPVMATAAYNAGPSRAKRWMAPEAMEAAIYIETIPFTETRTYVQRVMANAHIYASRLGTKIQSLKSRIGIVPGTGVPESLDADEE